MSFDPSRPVRGAWIEMGQLQRRRWLYSSRPVRGAWIEISAIVQSHGSLFVAPREGRVD